MNVIKKVFRVLLATLLVLAGIAAVAAIFLLRPQNRSVDWQTMLSVMQTRIDSLSVPEKAKTAFFVGYAKENITPDHPTATAGYGDRMGKEVVSVHDSLFLRAMVIDNGTAKIAIVSADLLLMPPEVTTLLERELPSIGFSSTNTYFGATHSHNSMGNWSRGAMTVMYGRYDEALVQMLTAKVLRVIHRADEARLPATIASAHIPVPHAVRNRIDQEYPVDSLLRAVEIRRADSTRLLLTSFTAHATCLSSRNLSLSGDYPGQLTRELERSGYAFAMFMAGAVGSHGAVTAQREWPCVEEMAGKLKETFLHNHSSLEPVRDSTLWIARVRLDVSDPQFKVLKTWQLRPAAFNALLGDFPEYLTALRIGKVLMLGVPCDYSGEFYASLDPRAEDSGLSVMVTGFNGGYMGYVTPEEYYDIDHYETQLMNWYGRGSGEYLTSCLEMLIRHAAKRE